MKKLLVWRRRLSHTHPHSHASLLTRPQQKSKPRNGAVEILVSAVAEITRAIRLWRKLDSRARKKPAPNGDEIDSPREQKQLRYQLVIRWLGREDSNLRMAESKSAALPLGYAPSGGGFLSRRGARTIAAAIAPING